MTAMSKPKAVPNRVKQMRQAMGLKRAEMAVRLGVDPTTLWRWEERRAAIPDPQKIALAEFFRTSLDWLMCMEDGNGAREAA